MLGVEHWQEFTIRVIGDFMSHHIALALAHRKGFFGRKKAFCIFNAEDAAVLQHMRVVKQVDVRVPLANTVNPVIDILDKIDMQRVPLAVFPVSHSFILVGARDEVVAFFGDNLACKGAIWQRGHQLIVLIVDLARVGEKEHLALVLRLDIVLRFIVLAGRCKKQECLHDQNECISAFHKSLTI